MKRSIVLTFVIFALSFVEIYAAKVNFFRGSLQHAQEKAADEGKLYFVDFVASWCGPCKWMDETTFSDDRVINYVSQNYLPVKVDIDDFDGYAYKQKYNVNLLPSIIIFNSKGEQLAKYSESMSPSKLLEVLKSYDTPANRVRIPSATTPTPKPPTTVTTVPTSTTVSNPSPLPAAPAVATGNGLFEFDVKRKPSSGFSVQIGAFYEYGNVLIEVEKLKKRYPSRVVLVHIASLNNKPVYKILVGDFFTRSSADGFNKDLTKDGLPGFVKDLTTLK